MLRQHNIDILNGSINEINFNYSDILKHWFF